MNASGRMGLPSRKGAREMLTIVAQVNAPPGLAVGVKEDIAMRLEALGDVRVVSITEDAPEQLLIGDYDPSGAVQNGDETKGKGAHGSDKQAYQRDHAGVSRAEGAYPATTGGASGRHTISHLSDRD